MVLGRGIDTDQLRSNLTAIAVSPVTGGLLMLGNFAGSSMLFGEATLAAAANGASMFAVQLTADGQLAWAKAFKGGCFCSMHDLQLLQVNQSALRHGGVQCVRQTPSHLDGCKQWLC